MHAYNPSTWEVKGLLQEKEVLLTVKLSLQPPSSLCSSFFFVMQFSALFVLIFFLVCIIKNPAEKGKTMMSEKPPDISKHGSWF